MQSYLTLHEAAPGAREPPAQPVRPPCHTRRHAMHRCLEEREQEEAVGEVGEPVQDQHVPADAIGDVEAAGYHAKARGDVAIQARRNTAEVRGEILY